MSVVSCSRRWVMFYLLLVLAGLSLGIVAGCGKEEVDPYVYASLRAVTRGDTLSPNFLYEIDAPKLEFASGNTGVVRDGNLLEFIVGTDLARVYPSYQGAILGVQKFFKPTPYLMIKRVKRSGVAQPVDSCTTYVIPRILPPSGIDQETPGGPLPKLKYNQKTEIEAYLPSEENDNKPVLIKTAFDHIVYQPRVGLPDSLKMSPREQDMAWYAVGEESSFEIVDLTPGAEFMLHLILERNLPLYGVFTMTEMEDNYAERKAVHEGLGHLIGKVKMIWFSYANAYIEGSPEI
jgi:hypothetical protein